MSGISSGRQLKLHQNNHLSRFQTVQSPLHISYLSTHEIHAIRGSPKGLRQIQYCYVSSQPSGLQPCRSHALQHVQFLLRSPDIRCSSRKTVSVFVVEGESCRAVHHVPICHPWEVQIFGSQRHDLAHSVSVSRRPEMDQLVRRTGDFPIHPQCISHTYSSSQYSLNLGQTIS